MCALACQLVAVCQLSRWHKLPLLSSQWLLLSLPSKVLLLSSRALLLCLVVHWYNHARCRSNPDQVKSETDLLDDIPDILQLFMPWTPTAGTQLSSLYLSLPLPARLSLSLFVIMGLHC